MYAWNLAEDCNFDPGKIETLAGDEFDFLLDASEHEFGPVFDNESSARVWHKERHNLDVATPSSRVKLCWWA